jgi:hypothetical protein
MCHESQRWDLMAIKRTISTLILFNPVYLTIGSKLNLIHSELWFYNVIMHILIFFLCLKFSNLK